MNYYKSSVRSAYNVNEHGNAEQLTRIPFMSGSFNEEWLQELIEKNPSMLPTKEFGFEYSPLICIGREVPVGSSENKGYIDNLYISPSGQITIVETKLFRNQEARRTVVAQIIDYAKELQKWDCEKINSVAASYFLNTEGQSLTAFDAMVRSGFLTFADEGRFNDNINKGLSSASFLLLIVGDGIRSGVHQLVEFLNDNASMRFTLGLVEIEVYQRDSSLIIIPNTITKTSIIERSFLDTQNNCNKQPPVAKKPVLSRREFIDVFADNGGYDPDEITEFICDIESISGITVQLTPTELTLRFSPEDGFSYALLTFSISLNHADLYVMPGRIISALERHGHLPCEANSFLCFFKQFVNENRCRTKPYDNIDGFYYADICYALSHTGEFIRAIEQFITTIQ